MTEELKEEEEYIARMSSLDEQIGSLTDGDKKRATTLAEKYDLKLQSVYKAILAERLKTGVAKNYTVETWMARPHEYSAKGTFQTDDQWLSHFTANAKSHSVESTKKRNKSLKRAATTNLGNDIKSAMRVVPEVQTHLRKRFSQVDAKTGQTYIEDYLDNFLAKAKANTAGRESMLLASSIFSENLLRELDSTLEKKMEQDREFLRYRIRNLLYDKQQEVFDNVLDQTIECICTRRAGKTLLISRMLVAYAALWKSSPVLYINRTFDNAVTQCGDEVENALKALNMHYTGHASGGVITLDNGGTITFGGYNNKGDIDRYRGGKFRLVVIDEIGHLRAPKSLIEEVLEPAQIDFGNEAKMVFTGTPPRVKKSYAYELWHNPKIKHYHWSFMDNPFIPNKETVIEKVCEKHGCTPDSPFIQREYFGNMEAFDVDSLVFKGYKTYEKLPAGTITHAWVGVDFGYEDNAAVSSFVVVNQCMYEVCTFLKSKQSISDIANEVVDQYSKLKEMKPANLPWVICDNNEKSAVYEFYQTYKIPNVACAYKYGKEMAIDQLADWMRTGRVFLKKDGLLQEEAENTVFKRDEEDHIIHEIDDEVFHPNGLFALLYVSRQYAYDVMGLVDTNKEANSISN